MAYEQRAGDIAVFKETDKKNEKGPDWKGTMIVPEGVKPGDKLEVAFWAKGDRGTMLAGSAKPGRSQADRQQVENFREGGSSGFSGRAGRLADDAFGDGSDIPF
jgi:hypothetical protein